MLLFMTIPIFSLRGVLLVFLLLGVALPGFTVAKKGIRVELALYSGEEDPYWLITDPQQVALVQSKVKNLPSAEAPPEWPALGWRGFRLRGLANGILPGQVTVFKGTVCILEGDRQRCYQDQNKLEAWLHAQARQHGLDHLIPAN